MTYVRFLGKHLSVYVRSNVCHDITIVPVIITIICFSLGGGINQGEWREFFNTVQDASDNGRLMRTVTRMSRPESPEVSAEGAGYQTADRFVSAVQICTQLSVQ